jgi:hypothetical protein
MDTPNSRRKKNIKGEQNYRLTRSKKYTENYRSGAATSSPLRRGMVDKKTHGIPCKSNIHIGEKDEHYEYPYLPARCCSNRLGGN